MSRITLIQGHPDTHQGHFGHALADAYLKGAEDAGHEVRRVTIAHIDFPLLRSHEDYHKGKIPGSLIAAQEDILWADHLVFFFPLWMGMMPALLKAFLEQIARPDIWMKETDDGKTGSLLKGKTARVVITMGMPAFWYRFYYGGAKNLKRGILNFVGIRPVRESFIGMIEALSPQKREAWLTKMQRFGKKGV
jgi:putative NADPH-quinone reductase